MTIHVKRFSFRVMVLDQGEIKEFDSPSTLLADRNSRFHSMGRDAGICISIQ